MSDATRILSQIETGDPAAAEQLLPLVYNELRKLSAIASASPTGLQGELKMPRRNTDGHWKSNERRTGEVTSRRRTHRSYWQ